MTNNLCCELDPQMICEECGGKVCDACWSRFYSFHEELDTHIDRIADGTTVYEPRRCVTSGKIVEHGDHAGLDSFPIFVFKHYD
jgi:hypothetical protein